MDQSQQATEQAVAAVVEKPDRCFMDYNGHYYKAKDPKGPGDCEKTVVSAEGMATLSATPMTEADWQAAIQLYLSSSK